LIYGKRIRLRAIEREDLSLFVNWLNDPDVRAGLLHFLPYSLVDEEQWFSEMQKNPVEEHPLVIEIRQGEEWIPVGDCGFFKIDWRCRAGEVGILIGEKRFWNQGYGTEVMRLLLRHGFNTLNLNRINLDVYENNPGAIRSYEKAGFIHEGCRRKAMYKEGKYIDVLQMSVLKDEWKDALQEA
jgi:diamine N-acetyltransferase